MCFSEIVMMFLKNMYPPGKMEHKPSKNDRFKSISISKSLASVTAPENID
jgi:hypothetical protein